MAANEFEELHCPDCGKLIGEATPGSKTRVRCTRCKEYVIFTVLLLKEKAEVRTAKEKNPPRVPLSVPPRTFTG